MLGSGVGDAGVENAKPLRGCGGSFLHLLDFTPPLSYSLHSFRNICLLP
jgi:hypothetical protein